MQKKITFLLLIVCIGAMIAAGCTTYPSSPTSTAPSQSETYSSSDPSAPQSYAEKYCLEVSNINVQKYPYTVYGGSTQYSPEVTITASIKSNCNYPVEAVAQLFAYDKNNNMIPGLFANGVQDAQPFDIKPSQTKTISTSFDMRRVPDNPRDTDPNTYASFNVTAFVTHIVSARDASSWP